MISLSLLCLLLWQDQPVPSLNHARTMLAARNIQEAIAELSELQKRNPNDPQVQYAIGKLLQDLAAQRAQRLSELAPDSPQAHELAGKSFEARQKFVEARQQYELAAKGDPMLPGIHFLIGNLLWKQRDLDGAQNALELELRLNPDHSMANLRMGQILLAQTPEAQLKAIPYLQKAAADSNTGLTAHLELGKALRLAGRNKEALRELKLVAEMSPHDEFVHAQLAGVYKQLGDNESFSKEMLLHKAILDRKRQAAIAAHQNQGR